MSDRIVYVCGCIKHCADGEWCSLDECLRCLACGAEVRAINIDHLERIKAAAKAVDAAADRFGAIRALGDALFALSEALKDGDHE